jgi:hypothetical protein
LIVYVNSSCKIKAVAFVNKLSRIKRVWLLNKRLGFLSLKSCLNWSAKPLT